MAVVYGIISEKKDESPPTNRILRGTTKQLDAEGVLELIQEDKYSTKSVNGSSQNQDFSKYKDIRLSRLFESIQLGHAKHMDHSRDAQGMINRSGSNVQFGTSEVFALKRELDRKSREPIILNMAVIGRKSVGKTSFIKMVLNYVGFSNLEERGNRIQSRRRSEEGYSQNKHVLKQETPKRPRNKPDNDRHSGVY